MKWIASFYIATITAASATVLEKTPAFIEDYLSQNPTAGILGWIPVAAIDISGGDDCPDPFQKITENGVSMCRVPSEAPGCYSANFSVGGQSYMEIVGALRGYQKGSPDAFSQANVGINGVYVDGVSITIGMPRIHVWTYGVGVSVTYNYPSSCCPCAVYPGKNTPPYVGDKYFCQSGCEGRYSADTFYTSNPLWQGYNCTAPADSCCSYGGQPVFHRIFPIKYDEDIEVRICASETFSSEAILIDQLFLFVR